MSEGGGFGGLTEDVLDSVGETFVVTVAESGISPTYFCGQVVELDVVLEDFLVLLHTKVVKFFLSIALRVDRAEIGFQLSAEFAPVMHPRLVALWIQQRGLKPLKHSVMEIGECEIDFCGGSGKCFLTISEK